MSICTSVGCRLLGVAALVVYLSLGSPSVHAEDWPQWRGLNRDGVWRETGVLDAFPQGGLKPIWEQPISSGYSGPSVANGRVYITDRVVEPKQTERVWCLDEATGEKVWMHEYDCEYNGVGYEAGPRSNVTIHDGKAYALGTMGHFFCFDAASGKILFQHDLNAEYKVRMPIWGLSCSPLIEGDLCILQVGGTGDACLVAFDKHTGVEKWKALPDDASYSAPIVIEQGGKRVLVCWTGNRLAGLNPQTGEVYWQEMFKPQKMVINIATPVVERNHLFVTAFYDGSLMMELDPNKPAARKVWRRLGKDERNTDALHSIISTPYLSGDYIYGCDSYGELRCLDAKTGDRIWEDLTATPKARWSNIHFVKNGDKVWMFNERGELLITQLTPERLIEISRTKIIEPTEMQLRQRGGVCWAHPAFANKRVYIRNDEKILCVDVSK